MATADSERYVRLTLLTFEGGKWISKHILVRELGRLPGSPSLVAFLSGKKAYLKQKRRNHELKAPQFRLLYPTDGSDTNVEDWDLLLLLKVILYLFSDRLSCQEKSDLQEILRIRNEVICHARQPSVSEHEFLTNWNELVGCIYRLSTACARDIVLQASTIIGDFKTGPLSLQDSLDKLAQLCRNDEHMEHVVAGLRNIERRQNVLATHVASIDSKIDDQQSTINEVLDIAKRLESCRTTTETCKTEIPNIREHDTDTFSPHENNEQLVPGPADLSLAADGILNTHWSRSVVPSETPDGRIMKRNGSDECAILNPALLKSPKCPTQWKCGRRLGRGAFGDVHLCYDNDTEKQMAVKIVKLQEDNPEVSKEVRDVENEITFLQKLEHKRIVQYFGCWADNSDIYIFMEYMAGGSIAHIISKDGPIQEKTATIYTGQILEGLAFLHEKGIIHRDIKCANILHDNNDYVKLSDFGTSKQLRKICSTYGDAKTFVGTVFWMAPEVVKSEEYGRKADIWSLACTVVEMLTTKPPWSEYEVYQALYQIGKMEKLPTFELPQERSEYAVEFLNLIFKWDPKERPTAEDLLTHPFVST